MNLESYLIARKKTDRDFGEVKNILHTVMGLLTELDELMDCEAFEITDEAGDVIWYLYKPLSYNTNWMGRKRDYTQLGDDLRSLVRGYKIEDIKRKALDSYKKVEYQEHNLNAMRKDGFTHLEIFQMLMAFAFEQVEMKLIRYGLDIGLIFDKNISKLSARFEGGNFDARKSMNRDDELNKKV